VLYVCVKADHQKEKDGLLKQMEDEKAKAEDLINQQRCAPKWKLGKDCWEREREREKGLAGWLAGSFSYWLDLSHWRCNTGWIFLTGVALLAGLFVPAFFFDWLDLFLLAFFFFSLALR
jgi:hypothetical protein